MQAPCCNGGGRASVWDAAEVRGYNVVFLGLFLLVSPSLHFVMKSPIVYSDQFDARNDRKSTQSVEPSVASLLI